VERRRGAGDVTSLAGLLVRADVAAWERIGLVVEDGVSWVGGVALQFSPLDDAAPGLTGWVLEGEGSIGSIDGVETSWVAELDRPVRTHPLGATSFDHVVVMTSSLERTCGSIEAATGAPLKRVREAGAVRQGFHRLGPVIVEVVESAQVTGDAAALWGLVLIVEDIHEATGRLGPEVVSRPKTAVQPGRLIASFRAEAGLGLPVALMSA